MVEAPSPGDEEFRRVGRARKVLTSERVRHVNRINGLMLAGRRPRRFHFAKDSGHNRNLSACQLEIATRPSKGGQRFFQCHMRWIGSCVPSIVMFGGLRASAATLDGRSLDALLGRSEI